MSSSAPFFPPPQKKESPPYRAAAEISVVDVKPVYPELREKPRSVKEVAPPEPEPEPLLVRFAWRVAARVVALAATVGILWALVRAHELGEKWPNAVFLVLGVVGILAAPVILYFRLRALVRLVRTLFAKGQ